jgi:DNA-binding CsgD family transcriptional regulator
MTDDAGPVGADLTPREREVLAMVAAGMTNREIGAALFISESTAGVHVSNLMAKLGVGSRTEAAALAVRAGLVESAGGDPHVDQTQVVRTEDAMPPPVTGWWARLKFRYQQQVDHHPRRVAAFGVGGLAILFLLTMGMAMAIFGEQPIAAEDSTASPRPRPSATPKPSSSLTPSESPAASPALVGGAGINLQIDGLASIRVDDLVLRAEAGTGMTRLGQLPGGATAFVVAGPVMADESVWWQIAAVDPYGTGCGSPQPAESLVCREWLGWAPAGGPDGEAWLTPVEPNCLNPGDPVTMTVLKPLERLACLGGRAMTYRLYATANPQAHGCAPGDTFTPAWLAPSCSAVRFELAEALYPAAGGLDINIAPNLGTCNEAGFGDNCPLTALQGRWLRITSHLDDPRAQECLPRPVGVGTLERAAAILRCRTALVGTRITVDDALGILDQEQVTYVPEFPSGYQPNGNGLEYWAGVAQAFQAGRSGELTAVQLLLNRVEGTQGAMVVELRRHGPSDELLATSQPMNWADLPTDSANCLPPQCLALDRQFAWVTITFGQPATVTAGQTYAIVLPHGQNTASNWPTFLVAASTADAYSAGEQWGREPGVADPWQANASGSDLAFRTIVR